MRLKQDFFSRGYFEVGNGSTMRFWKDVWLGDDRLRSNIRRCITQLNTKMFWWQLF
jgi:hypothetical protein